MMYHECNKYCKDIILERDGTIPYKNLYVLILISYIQFYWN